MFLALCNKIIFFLHSIILFRLPCALETPKPTTAINVPISSSEDSLSIFLPVLTQQSNDIEQPESLDSLTAINVPISSSEDLHSIFLPVLNQQSNSIEQAKSLDSLTNLCIQQIVSGNINISNSEILPPNLLNKIYNFWDDKIIDCWYTAHTKKSLASTILANKSMEQKKEMQNYIQVILNRRLRRLIGNEPILIKLHKVAYDWGLCIHNKDVQGYEETIQNKRLLCKTRLLQWYINLVGNKGISQYICTFTANRPEKNITDFPMINISYQKWCQEGMHNDNTQAFCTTLPSHYIYMPFTASDKHYTLCFFKPEEHNSISLRDAFPYIFVVDQNDIPDCNLVSNAYNELVKFVSTHTNDLPKHAKFLPNIDKMPDNLFEEFYSKIFSFDPNFIENETKHIVAQQSSNALLTNQITFSDQFQSPEKTKTVYLELLTPYINYASANKKDTCISSLANKKDTCISSLYSKQKRPYISSLANKKDTCISSYVQNFCSIL